MKPFILSTLLFVESLLLSEVIHKFVVSGDYLSFNYVVIAQISLLFLASGLTLSLLLCTKNKMFHYLIAPLSTFIPMVLYALNLDITYYALFIAAAFIILSYELFKVNRIKENLIKPDYRTLFKEAVVTYFGIFSLFAALLVILTPDLFKDFNIGRNVADVSASTIRNAVGDQIDQILGQYKTLGLGGVVSPNIDFNKVIESEVNRAMEPYVKYTQPVMSILAFGFLQLISLITIIIYNLVVYPLFWMAIKIGLLKAEKVMVEKEDIVL